MKTTRRNFMAGAAATSLPVTAVASPLVGEALSPAENPDLIRAHKDLIAARVELSAAKDALDWIVDEWRHVWPLAPERLLWGANADTGSRTDGAEKDIAGRFLFRNTAELTLRFTLAQRQKMPRACFTVMTANDARETIDRWENSAPRGKSPKTIERHRTDRQASLTIYREKLALAEEYEAKTKELREKAGVAEAKLRIDRANDEVYSLCSEVSKLPAFGMEGLALKADALNSMGFINSFVSSEGIIGEMARFVQQVITLQSRASS